MADGEMVVAAQNGKLDVERARAAIESCTNVNQLIELKTAAEAAAFYRERKGQGIESINEMVAIVLRAQKRLGDFLLEAPLPKGRPKKSVPEGTVFTLRQLGITRKESVRCQALARTGDEEFDDYLRDTQEKGQKLTFEGAVGASAAAGYDGDEWYTPLPYIAAAREVFGGPIELDPASCEFANQVVQAERFFTKKDDGLKQEWIANTLWMNQPSSDPLVRQFTSRLVDEFAAGRVKQAVMLQNSATDTEWFHQIAPLAMTCCPRGRINYYNTAGKSKANRYCQTFFYLGEERARFAQVFARFGLISTHTAGLPPPAETTSDDEALDDGPL